MADASRARARNVSGVSHSEHQYAPVALAPPSGPLAWGVVIAWHVKLSCLGFAGR